MSFVRVVRHLHSQTDIQTQTQTYTHTDRHMMESPIGTTYELRSHSTSCESQTDRHMNTYAEWRMSFDRVVNIIIIIIVIIIIIIYVKINVALSENASRTRYIIKIKLKLRK